MCASIVRASTVREGPAVASSRSLFPRSGVPTDNNARVETRNLPWRRTVVIGVVAAVMAGSALGLVVNVGSVGWLELNRLAHDEVRVRAIITAYDPDNHNSCSDRYPVAGTTYTNTDSCGDYNRGRTVVTVYDRHHAGISIAGRSPAFVLTGELAVWFVAMGGFGLDFAGGSRQLYRRLFAGEPRIFPLPWWSGAPGVHAGGRPRRDRCRPAIAAAPVVSG